MNQPTEEKGKLIVFEGPDGFGKSTQAELAFDYLMKKKRNIVLSKEPGSELSPFTRDLREMIFHSNHSTMLNEVEQGLLLFIDHYHNAKTISHITKVGCNVISDRWLYSQYCYDSIKLVSQVDATGLYLEYEHRQIQPDLVLLLGLDKEEGYRRIKKREEENEKQTKQSHKPWAQGDYLGELIKQYSYLYHDLVDRITTVDIVPRNEETPEEVFEKYVKPQLDKLFKEKKGE